MFQPSRSRQKALRALGRIRTLLARTLVFSAARTYVCSTSRFHAPLTRGLGRCGRRGRPARRRWSSCGRRRRSAGRSAPMTALHPELSAFATSTRRFAITPLPKRALTSRQFARLYVRVHVARGGELIRRPPPPVRAPAACRLRDGHARCGDAGAWPACRRIRSRCWFRPTNRSCVRRRCEP